MNKVYYKISKIAAVIWSVIFFHKSRLKIPKARLNFVRGSRQRVSERKQCPMCVSESKQCPMCVSESKQCPMCVSESKQCPMCVSESKQCPILFLKVNNALFCFSIKCCLCVFSGLEAREIVLLACLSILIQIRSGQILTESTGVGQTQEKTFFNFGLMIFCRQCMPDPCLISCNTL